MKPKMSPVLARLIEEVRQEKEEAARPAPSAYNRIYNRHHRSGGYNRAYNRVITK